MADDTDRYITERESALRFQNIQQSLDHINASLDELKELKNVLNPAFSQLKQKVDNHVTQDIQEKKRRRERWSTWQIVMTAILAAATVGMFLVALSNR